MRRHRLTPLLLGVLVAVYCGLNLWNITGEVGEVRDDLATASGGMTEIGAEYLRTVMDVTRGILEDVAARPDLFTMDPDDLLVLLWRKANILHEIDRLVVYDREGRIYRTNREHPVQDGQSFSDRAYFAVHRMGGHRGLYIGQVVKSRISGEMVLPVSIALRDDHGFAGVVAAFLPVAELRQPLARLQIPSRMSAELLWPDGMVTLSSRNDAHSIMAAALDLLGLYSDIVQTRDFEAGQVPFHLTTQVHSALFIDLVLSRSWTNIVLLLVPLPFSLLIGIILRRREHERAAMLQDIVDNIGEGVALTDKNGNIVLRNAGLRCLVRDSSGELDAAALCRDGSVTGRQSLGDGRELDVTRADLPGERRLLVVRDVTALVQAQQALEAHNAALTEALAKERLLHETQRAFVSMVSHEVRTPLAIIDASAYRLQKRLNCRDEPRVLQAFTNIREAVARLSNLTERVLSVARYEAGRIELRPGRLDPAALVRDVCARQTELTPDYRFSLDLDGLPAEIPGDLALLDQVFTNLVGNAVKYSPGDKRIELRGWIEREREGTETGWACISVRDRGIGIPAEDIPRLFERFFRAGVASIIPGTGIGLYLSKELVDLHGGSIRVDSRPGEGTCFTLRLPLAEQAVEAEVI